MIDASVAARPDKPVNSAKDGKIVAKIQLDKDKDPQIHGLELKDGVLWYCDASKGWICNLS